ncbi:hypothetical protein PV05_11762 [Exophiala xenobiotica]|uniref:Succinate--CoA ligase [ADP-forming] subunit beta, mitochondrial n=1 Tax=Exophiala xenobiotica TaxID=348802 RepID=A0A0D2BD97_9EURO|nr:uncharacterized protein PV05_11762 [Exophiala xenobiotica]KIW50146.1 hypothetical protein PV05_11762 [Exophiala xenobiotica]
MFKTLRKRPAATALQNISGVVSTSSKRHLSLHEHQAQGLLGEYGIDVPRGRAATSVEEVGAAVTALGGNAVLKSQILAGGRGKGSFDNGLKSGVHIVSSKSEAEKFASRMLGHKLVTKQTSSEGLPVNQLYVTEKVDIADEYYLAFTVSREHYAPVLLMCKGGGTGIEELAARSPEEVINVPLKYSEGITDDIVSTVCQKLELGHERHAEVKDLLSNLYRVFRERDATLLEINPLVQNRKSRQLMCADTKLTVDNAAAHRQGEVFQLRDLSQEKPIELEAEKHGLVYIQLEGSIGCLVNGAGLAMATNDAVAHFGGKCANFLDGGGQADVARMVKAFELILSDQNVNTILVNIYGGIIRCDMIAEAVIAAAQHFGDVPVVVRLQGTNAEQGQQMIAKSGLKLFAESEFDGAVKKAIELSNRATTRTQDSSTSQAAQKSPPNNYVPSNVSIGRKALRAFSTSSFSSSILKEPRASTSVLATRQQSRPFRSSSRRVASYNESIPNLAINQNTRVMYQGFTGRAASRNAVEAIKYGTNIVGGVSRSQKSSSGKHTDASLASLPVFSTVRQAVDEIKPDASAVFIPAQFAADAIIESIEAEVPLIVSVAEHIPVHDMLRVQEVLRTQSKSRLVGPNCPGIISPVNACKIGIMPHLQYAPGIVGIASKSGTLSYEAVGSTTKAGLGQSLCVGVGGDLLPGTSLLDAVTAMIEDPATKGIVLLGEIGGDAEIRAAALLKQYREGEIKAGRKPKPVVGMVTGRTAPKGRTMGHAGAIAGGGSSVTAEDKVKAMQDAGIVVPVHPGEIGPVMKELLRHAEITW